MRLSVCLIALLPTAVLADAGAWRAEVRAAECAFAKSMADRDFEAFARHLHEDAMFFAPGLRQGRAAVLEGWKPFYEGRQAPFSWAPDRVEVLRDGRLAHSTGLVRDPQGRAISRFSSVWQQVEPGRWLVLIDNGGPLTAKEREQAAEPDPRPC